MKKRVKKQQQDGYSITDDPRFIVIDLFCGAGGTTTGFADTDGIAAVVACVNHDPKAIKSHWMNHPEVQHYEEDITKLYGEVLHGTLFMSPHMMQLQRLVNIYRAFYPNAKVILWASLECTNFSKAKGGQARDADSRTLAEHLNRYVSALDPDYIQIENVVEFMSWGPLDENGKPVSKKKGRDYLRWIENMNGFGYRDEWRELNSANYGAYTSRNRLFGIFAKPGLPIAWPEPTHSKNPEKTDLFNPLQRWKPVKDVLDFKDEGKSIFGRKKPLSDKTLERIYAGLIKFVAGGKEKFLQQTYACSSNSDNNFDVERPARTITTRDATQIVSASFISKQYSGDPESKNITVDGPAGTITCIDSQALVNTSFISKYNGGNPESRNTSMEEPCHTVTTENRHSVISPVFITKYYSGDPENKSASLDGPAPTVRCKDGQALIQAAFIQKHFSGKPEGKVTSVESPAGTICTNGNQSLIQASFITQRHGGVPESKIVGVDQPARTLTTTGGNQDLVQPCFIANYYSNGGELRSIEAPSGTVTTKDRSALVQPQYLVNYNHSSTANDVNGPGPTITAADKLSIVHPQFIDKQYGFSDNTQSLDRPAGSILTNDKHCLISTEHFIDRNFSGGGQNHGVDQPAGSVLTVPKMNIVSAFVMNTNYNNSPSSLEAPAPTITANRKWAYLVNPSWVGATAGVDSPSPVIIARQDKAPLYLINTETGDLAIEIQEGDSEIMVKIKHFMALYGIVDIKMRMLKVLELLKIQGFPADYQLFGNQSDQKKFIGNSVVPLVVKEWALALADGLRTIPLSANSQAA